MPKSLYFLLQDIYYQLVPWSTPSRKVHVAFIVHPRTEEDTIKKFPFLRFLPLPLVRALMKRFWVVSVAPIHVGEKRNEGIVLSIPLTAKQMLDDRKRAVRYIQDAYAYAHKRGARVVGLGALTASLTHGGTLLAATDATPRITTGRLFTSLNVASLVERGVTALSRNKETIVVSIVGAAGSIGSAVAQILSYWGYTNFILIDLSNKKERMEEIHSYIKEHNKKASVTISDNLNDVKGSHVIVTATSKEGALIMSEHVAPGVIIVDDAQPSDVDEALLMRDDLLILSGGAVRTPHVKIPFDMGLKDSSTIYSCLAEALLLNEMSHVRGSSLGEFRKIDMDTVQELKEVATQFSFESGVFQNNKRVYSDSDVEHMRSLHL